MNYWAPTGTSKKVFSLPHPCTGLYVPADRGWHPVHGDKRLDSLMQNDTWTLDGTSNPIWRTQAKDGDIRLRWTFLVPASDDVARSATINLSDVATAYFLVSRRVFKWTLYNMMPRDTLRSAYDLCLAEVWIKISVLTNKSIIIISQVPMSIDGLSSAFWSSAAVISTLPNHVYRAVRIPSSSNNDFEGECHQQWFTSAPSQWGWTS